jgi:CBS domain-containing protein
MEGWDSEKTLGEQLVGQNILLGYADELVGALADRMAESDTGRVPILKREDGSVVGLVARRDLLRVRAEVIRHERERERLIRLRGTPERMKDTVQP